MNELQQRHYELCLANGCGERLASSLATQRAPYGKCRNNVLRGHSIGEEFEGDDRMQARYRRHAKKAGVSLNGKKFISQLATYPGDPEAWISTAEDVKRICKKRNWTCRGMVEHKHHENPPRESIPMDKQIFAEEVQRECEKDPGKLHKLEKTKAEVWDKITPGYKKNRSSS